MKAICTILTAALLTAPAAGEPLIKATLKVALEQDEGPSPYRLAELSLTSSAPTAAEAVVLRPVGGGPMVRYPLTVAPGQTASETVALPAVWPVQLYKITALDAAGTVLGFTVAEITWPAERVATDQFIDDAFRGFADAPAAWPAPARRSAALLWAIFAVAAAAALFVRPQWLRVAAVVGAAAVAGAAVVYVPGWPDAVEATEYHLEIHPQSGPVELDSFTVLSARRTRALQRRTERIPHPVYPDRAAAARDDAKVTPPERTIRLTVRPGQVRILRPAKNRPRGASPTFVHPTATDVDGVLQVEIGPGLRRGFVLRDDAAWTWPTDRSAPGRSTLRPAEAQPLWQVLSRTAQQHLEPEQVRLFRYWRQKYQRAGTLYVMAFGRGGRHVGLTAVEVRMAASTGPRGV